jgi:tetratricopeptide (TPR) repeat protein
LADFTEAIRLKPDYADTFYNRGVVRREKGDLDGARADFQKCLQLGGGICDGNQAQIEVQIRELQERLKARPRK